jgi:hypothetical protein
MSEARAELAYATAHASDVDPIDLTVAAAAVGERRVATTWLKKMETKMSWLAVSNDPRLDDIRKDSDYPQLAVKPV